MQGIPTTIIKTGNTYTKPTHLQMAHAGLRTIHKDHTPKSKVDGSNESRRGAGLFIVIGMVYAVPSGPPAHCFCPFQPEPVLAHGVQCVCVSFGVPAKKKGDVERGGLVLRIR